MHAWAEIRRQREGDGGAEDGDAVVARGPLVFVAHGLCALQPPELRAECWIASEAGDFDAAGAEELLRLWAFRPAIGTS